MNTKKTERARLDPKGTAEPKTRLLGHAPAGVCLGPGSVNADAIEDTATGKRTSLAADPEPSKRMHEITSHGAVRGSFTSYIFELERLACEAEGHIDLLKLVEKGDDLTYGPQTLKYIREEIQKRLDTIHRLAKVPR